MFLKRILPYLTFVALNIIYAFSLNGSPAEFVDTRTIVPLSAPWLVQPASAPDVLPDVDAWAKTDSMDTGARWRQVASGLAKGTPWEKSDPLSFMSLWYEKTFQIPKIENGKRVWLRFTAINGEALIFLNGKEVGALLDPTGEIDLTDFIEWGGENLLRVFLTRDTDFDFNRDANRAYLARIRDSSAELANPASWPFGINRPVELMIRPDSSLTDVFVQTSWREKSISFEVETQSGKTLSDVRIVADVFDSDRKLVKQLSGESFDLEAGEAVQRLSTSWEDPVCWELESPYLYTAKIRLMRGDETVDVYPEFRFGFREVWTEGKKIFLNGHPSRWRLTEIYGTDANGLSLYRLMGYNVGEIQPHSKLWGYWNNLSTFDTSVMQRADEIGMGLLVPGPSINGLKSDFLDDPILQERYRQWVEMSLKPYRNHPSILAWEIGMNSYNPRSNIHADTLGKREQSPHGKGKIINKGVELAKTVDPTRLVFSHADGSVGDVSSANVYLNFIPLQEREEWMMEWARNGDMPYSAVEFGILFNPNFWKKKSFLITEYLSMYYGDDAFDSEKVGGLERTIEWGLGNTRGFGCMLDVDLTQFPVYWDMISLFVKNTNRSWRSWGVSGGWLYWILYDYGVSPYNNGRNAPYRNFPEPLSKKPDWVNERFDIHKQANQPLLAYIGGSPVHTDKTHAYFAGEPVEKQISVVWDGHLPRKLQAFWNLVSSSCGEAVAAGEQVLELGAGEIRQEPIRFEMPLVQERTDFELKLVVKDGDAVVAEDSFKLQAFPRFESLADAPAVAVYDPKGRTTSWLKSLGAPILDWAAGDSLDGVDVLVIGREALTPGSRMPWAPDDLARGLRVLVMEQQPTTWEQLGFKTQESMPRYVFVRDTESPILEGLEPEDFINWRGSPDLLPEGRLAKLYDARHPPKWTNRHAVASVVLKTPEVVGFTPLLEADFGMAYSPLLEYRHGKGSVYFCTLDLTDRVGVDPAATRVASNLLGHLGQSEAKQRKTVYYVGNDTEKARLSALGIELSEGGLEAARANSKSALLVAGADCDADKMAMLREFAQSGGEVFYVPQSVEALTSHELTAEKTELFKVEENLEISPLTRGIGPNLLRWRDALELNLFATTGQPENVRILLDGLLLEHQTGKGREVFLQASPTLLEGRYSDDADKRDAIQLSVAALWRLTAQVLTNLGADSSADLTQSLTEVAKPAYRQVLGTWSVLGPFYSDEARGSALIDYTFDGEKDALEGGQNPNIVYRTADGRQLDWRATVEAGESGFVDIGEALRAGEGAVTYVTRLVESDKDWMARLSVGVDYWLRAWVNGHEVIRVDTGHKSPTPNAFMADVLLKKGTNVITMKIVAGSKGNGFWAELSEVPNVVGSVFDRAGEGRVSVSLYPGGAMPFDPYEYHYW